MVFYDNIGKIILQKRKEAGMTQEQLAEKLGTSNRSISRWENGKTIPDISLFPFICQVLGISLTELLTGEREEKTEIKEKIIFLIHVLGEENQKHMQKMNKFFVSGFICLGVVLLHIMFGVLDLIAEPNIFSVFLVSFGIVCEITGLYYSSRRKVYTEKEIVAFLGLETNIKLSSAKEMLQYAKRKQRVDYKQYEKAFQAIEQKLTQDETVLFSMVADSFIVNENWAVSWKPWHIALAVSNRRILVSGEAMHGLLMTFYDVVSFELNDYSGVEMNGRNIIINFNDNILKIMGYDLESVVEQLKDALNNVFSFCIAEK